MKLKKRKGLLTIGMSVLLAGSILGNTTVAFAQSSDVKTINTDYGVMKCYVYADRDNAYWNASTEVANTAPVVYVKGECHVRSTGEIEGSSHSDTEYNAKHAELEYCGMRRSVPATLYTTHEVRGSRSVVQYDVIYE